MRDFERTLGGRILSWHWLMEELRVLRPGWEEEKSEKSAEESSARFNADNQRSWSAEA